PSTGAIPGRIEARSVRSAGWRSGAPSPLLIGRDRSLVRDSAARGPDGGAAERRDRGDHQEKIGLRHAAPEAAEKSREYVAGQRGRKPEPHHHGQHPDGSHFGDQRQYDRRKVEFADGGNGEIAAQP